VRTLPSQAYNGSSVLTAKEQNLPSLPETRVWGSGHFFPTFTRQSAPPSSTSQWGWTFCSYEIAVERLVGKYFPYGQERPSATTDGKEKFATYFRDSETGLDYADQRYHQPGMGRFMTTDAAPKVRANDPGSWNRYAYTRGDPVNRADPGGTDDCPVGVNFCSNIPNSGEETDPFSDDCIGTICPLIDNPDPVNTNCFAAVGAQPSDPLFQECFGAPPPPPVDLNQQKREDCNNQVAQTATSMVNDFNAAIVKALGSGPITAFGVSSAVYKAIGAAESVLGTGAGEALVAAVGVGATAFAQSIVISATVVYFGRRFVAIPLLEKAASAYIENLAAPYYADCDRRFGPLYE